MSKNEFFKSRMEQSYVKSHIVKEYFHVWAKILGSPSLGQSKLRYIDLFCGPGRYEEDDSASTPLLVLDNIIRDPKLCGRVDVHFNDENTDFITQLKNEIETSTSYKDILSCISFSNFSVENIAAPQATGRYGYPPTLLFMDPWGYKGVNTALFKYLNYFGSEVIVFFNYNRVNMALSNPVMEKNMQKLFEEKRLLKLKADLGGKKPKDREIAILAAFEDVIRSKCNDPVLTMPYRFVDKDGSKTLHYLIHITTHPLGYGRMKEIMYRYANLQEDGIGTFDFHKANEKPQQMYLAFSNPLDELVGMLSTEFKGKKIKMKEIYYKHNVGKSYVEKNYKDALLKMERNGTIKVEPPIFKRRKHKGHPTMGDECIITFL